MNRNIYIYLIVMAGVTYAIRVLPLTLIRKQIKNQFFQSFLFYVPYVTLAVMSFPAILRATQSPISGAFALIICIITAWFGAGLFTVSLSCCATVFICELLLFPPS
jgi:branched-subunit amino acid transport protein